MNLLKLKQPNVAFIPDFLTAGDADDWLTLLTKSLNWRQDPITLFGKTHLIPRLQSFIADNDVTYTYSGLTLTGNGFPTELQRLKDAIEQRSGYCFNALLANLYRDGNDHMGWHSDDEKELGTDPIIASLSLGAERTFKLRDKQNKRLTIDYQLTHGSLLIMGQGVQTDWDHSLPKRRRVNDPRINLTFRQIV